MSKNFYTKINSLVFHNRVVVNDWWGRPFSPPPPLMMGLDISPDIYISFLFRFLSFCLFYIGKFLIDFVVSNYHCMYLRKIYLIF